MPALSPPGTDFYMLPLPDRKLAAASRGPCDRGGTPRHPGRRGSSSRSRIPRCHRWDRMIEAEGAEGRSGRWQPPDRSRTLSGQVQGEVLVHLEHDHLVLAEDALELVVGQDLAAVLRVLQVVGLDVLWD